MRHFNSPILRHLALGIGLALPLSAFAAPGYWSNNDGQTWHNRYGKCWHTPYWTSQDATSSCDANLLPKPKPVVAAKPAPVAPAPKPKIITLNETASGKAHFGFNKYAVTPQQAHLLDSQLKNIKDADVKAVKVTGYTDRIGSAAYNLKLSQKRADAVAHYIKQHYDISADKIHAVGKGKTDLIVQCKGITNRSALIKCLAPDRRVTVEVDMTVTRKVPANQQ